MGLRALPRLRTRKHAPLNVLQASARRGLQPRYQCFGCKSSIPGFGQFIFTICITLISIIVYWELGFPRPSAMNQQPRKYLQVILNALGNIEVNGQHVPQRQTWAGWQPSVLTKEPTVASDEIGSYH